MNNLKICAVQLNIKWEDYDYNFKKVVNFVENYKTKADLIVFPEMFLTGFSNNTNLAIDENNYYIESLKSLATEKNVSICGSLMIKEDKCYFNRFYYFSSDGNVYKYNKRHLFRIADEDKHFCQGKSKLLIKEKQFVISPFVCYDLRFPVWMRNVNNSYDIAIIVANWPEKRIDAWNTLLKARAIENQCYVVGINRVGFDGNNIFYNGNTSVYDFNGNLLAKAEDDVESAIIAELDINKLVAFRKSFPIFLDADRFNIL
jgi:predicted amidohydrolase